jgi:GNAT superfamily N-acetyltransferase
VIELLAWDSQLFGRKIGSIVTKPESRRDVESSVATAKDEHFKYLSRRLRYEEFDTVRWFEESGFHVADIGVVWQCKSDLSIGNADVTKASVPTPDDIPQLQHAMHRIWNDSRFYHDPFFTESEADLVFAEWVKNSITGQAAHAAFTVDNVSLITCKRLADGRGDIPLVGVNPSHQGQGLGRHLVARALQWFRDNGCRTVTVRTQLRNIPALNFYRSIGFTIGWTDMTLSKSI